MAKKILALAMAIALVVCFAVSASAADNVTTVTTYVDGEASVEVTVSADENANVTYYATKNGAPVFVDQKKVEEGKTAVTFDFVTAIGNVGSTVVVGYTDGAKDTGVIPDADKYAIIYGGDTLASVYPGEGATVTIANPAGEFESVTGVTATNATASYEVNGTEIEVTLSNVQGEAVITVTTAEIEIPEYAETLEIADAAAIVVKEAGNDEVEENLGDNEPDVNAAVGNRKLTVCGKAGAFDKYGIIVSETAITAGSYRAIDALGDAYEAMDKDDDNKFAVQIIDTSDDGAIINAANSYYTAVYGYSAANQAYYVEVLADAVKAN